MPFYAYDDNNLSCDRVHVDDWLVTKQRRGNPYCKVCETQLNICAERTPSQASHFCHLPGSSCPTIERSAEPYSHLEDVEKDLDLEAENKRQTRENIHRIFNKCKYLCANLNFQEFREIFAIASNYQVWSYVNVNVEHIPYILLTCRDYFKSRRPYRKGSFYFVFSPVSGLDGLWIQPKKQSAVLFQVSKETGDIVPLSIRHDLNSYPNTSDINEYTLENIMALLD